MGFGHALSCWHEVPCLLGEYSLQSHKVQTSCCHLLYWFTLLAAAMQASFSAGLTHKSLTVVRDSLTATMHTDTGQKLVQGPVPLVTAWVAGLICSVSAPSGASVILKLHVWLSIGACSDALAISAPCNAAEDGQ